MGVMFYVGDEPYWIDSEIRKATEGIGFPEMNLLKTDRLNEDVLSFLTVMPFMAARKVAVVTVEDLSACDGPLLKGFHCPGESDLIIRARNYDTRKAFFTELKKSGCITVCSKAALGKKLDGFVAKKATERGMRFTEEAFQELLYLENYPDAEEVTCYSILSDLDSIAAVSDEEVTPEIVRRMVPSHLKGNAFVVAGMIVSGNVAGLKAQAEMLKGQEILSLAALLREYRIAYKACFHRLTEIGVTRKTLELSRNEAVGGIKILTEALRSVKSDSPKSQILQDSYLRLVWLHQSYLKEFAQ